MNANTRSNLDQLAALHHSKVQSSEVLHIIEKRKAQAETEINQLRELASKKPGTDPARVCNLIASEIETELFYIFG